MTGGVVVVLGPTGRNFAAGMSNGVAYVLDEQDQFRKRVNTDLVHLERVMRSEDLELLYTLVREHFEKTGSPKARQLLDAWDAYRGMFWKVAADPPPPLPEAQTVTGAPRQVRAAKA
jgi:glutamate synthase domain-containing protein 3